MPDRVRPHHARSIFAVAATALGLCAGGFLLVALPWYLTRGVASAPAAPPAGAWEAVARVIDPELGANVVDLGLVREIRSTAGGRVDAVVILTSGACPYEGLIVSEIARALRSVPGVTSAHVTVDRRAVWTPELATPELRRRFGLRAAGGS
jgi:metal-sulfur cluster biosynthetic enzyme